jgi:hypothetical protein
MIKLRTLAFTSMVLAGMALATRSEAGGGVRWSIGVGYGPPPYYYRPWGPYYYYPYRAVYVEPAPIYVQPPPVVVQQAPVVQQTPSVQPVYQTPTLSPVTAQTTSQVASPAEIEFHLRQLADPNENTRADSVMQLGRMKAASAIDPLAATLAGDRSARVREAAARALALIGSPKALPALQQAALADGDRDVRRSAQFAVDIVQGAK